MKEKKIKEIIESNINNLPISYSEIVIKKDGDEKPLSKITKSEHFKDAGYNLYPFYKKITRLI